MRVVVTGSAGFIGRAVCDRLAGEGHEVVPFDRRDGQDVTDHYACHRNIQAKEADAVIHLAGMLGTDELFDTVHEAIDANVHGTVNILDSCVVSGARYVGITMPPSGWANIYSATKHCAVHLAEAYRRHRGIRVSHVRAFNAYGPGQAHGPNHPRKIVPSFSARSWAGEPIEIWGDGFQTVDLIHTDDIARMLVDALEYGDGETFDAGTGVAMTVVEVANRIAQVTGSPIPHRHLPMRRGEDKDTQIVALGEGWDQLGWRPVFDEEKFAEAVGWYRRENVEVA